ncbi:MAG: glycosyltransferase family 39 protein [Pirellulales bacterium]
MIALAAVAVRAGYLSESLWVDELHSAWTISGSWSEVASRAAQGNNLPSYFWLLHAVSSIAGHSESALRLPSLGMSLILLVGMAWTVRRWTNNPLAGWIAAACMMLDRDFIFFSVEARPYAAVQLVTAGLLAITPSLALAPNLTHRLLAVALQAAGFYLHPTAILTWPAVMLARLVCVRLRPIGQRPGFRQTSLEIAIDSAILVVALLPASPVLLEIFQRRNNWQSIPTLAPSSASLTRAVRLLHLGIYALVPVTGWLATLFVECCCASPSSSTGTPTVPTNASATLSSPEDDGSRQQGELLRAALLSCWLWGLVPLGLVLLTTRFGWAPLLMLRYIWSAKLGVLCGASIAVTSLPSRICRTIASIVLVVCVAWQLGPATLGPERICERWREALTTISQLDPHGRDVILVRSKLIEAGYLRPVHTTPAIDNAADAEDGANADDRRLQEWRTYLAFPLATRVYPLPHSAQQILPLNNDLAPSLSETERQLLDQAPAIWLVARGSRDETRSVLEAIERQLHGPENSWHRSVDSSGPCLHLVRWTRGAARVSHE